jgi:hypothetical protein
MLLPAVSYFAAARDRGDVLPASDQARVLRAVVALGSTPPALD